MRKTICTQEDEISSCPLLCAAAILNVPDAINYLLTSEENSITSIYDDMNSLFLAIHHKNHEALKALLINPTTQLPRSFAHTLVNTTRRNLTPLHFAIYEANLDAVKLLLSYGAKLDNTCDSLTPLQAAERLSTGISDNDPMLHDRKAILNVLRLLEGKPS